MAKAAFMDYAGVLLAGTAEDSSKLVRQMVTAMGGNPQATIWGSECKTSVTLAALANGTAAHAIDYDDTNSVMIAHPSIQLLPGLCALGEYEHRSGIDILVAYVVGFEVGATIGRILNPNHIAQGWFPVGTLGPLMQTAASARLLKLTHQQTQMALGLATNLASGLRCNSGTMAKSFLAGHVASSAILAATLAREGLTANPNALEDHFGYFDNFSRGKRRDLESAISSLGNNFEILESGISFKLYPCCAGAHVPIDCALEIARLYSPPPDEIESIRVMVHSGLSIVLIHPIPKTVNEARFSLKYCVSRAMIDSQMGLEQFCQEKIDDPIVRALIQKVNLTYYEAPVTTNDMSQNRFPVEMTVRLKDGTVYSSRVEHAKGTPRNPLSFGDLEEKYRQCCKGKLSVSRVSDVLHLLRNLENLEDIAGLISMFN